MRQERIDRFTKVVHGRQSNLTVILENVHDHHNIGAVLRTCDSVGVKEIFVIYTDEHLDQEHLYLGTRASSGARKWVDVHFYTDIDACFEHVRRDYKNVFCTHLGESSKSLYELDLAENVALLFGNEHAGVSEETLKHCDGNFIIPQHGMVQSLNISVACAVSLYEALRQRTLKGFYTDSPTLNEEQREALLTEYQRRHVLKIKNKTVKRLNER